MFACCLADDSEVTTTELSIRPVVEEAAPKSTKVTEETVEPKEEPKETKVDDEAAPEYGTFTVNVPTTGGNIGLVLDVVDSTRGPMISQIDAGAVKTFNGKNPMQAVQVYDRIFDFDGATGCAEIQQKMRSGKMSNPAKMTLNRPKKMQVSIKKTGGLGVKLDFKGTSEGAVVNQIMSEGHIATWNSENPDQVIEVGDRIVSLNDKLLKGTKLMEELKTSTELKMMVLKY